MNISAALRYYRKISKMTQNQVAEEADVNEKYYGEIERNESSPTVDRLEKICLALGVAMQQVVSYKPVNEIVLDVETGNLGTSDEVGCYCNCCGTSFYSQGDEAVCPQCGCEYDEENNYIEKYQ